jgi:hypothetical protein
MIKLDIQSVTTDLSVQAMCSTETKTIRKEDLDDEVWAWLDRQYRNTSDQVSMDLVSVVNAFLFQKRNVATITRDYVAVIVRGDKNWKKNRGYDNNRYKAFIALATKTGIFEMIREGAGREPQIIRLRHPELVKALGISPEQERAWAKNCVDFVERNTTDDISDNATDAESQKASIPEHQNKSTSGVEHQRNIGLRESREAEFMNEGYHEAPIQEGEVTSSCPPLKDTVTQDLTPKEYSSGSETAKVDRKIKRSLPKEELTYCHVGEVQLEDKQSPPKELPTYIGAADVTVVQNGSSPSGPLLPPVLAPSVGEMHLPQPTSFSHFQSAIDVATKCNPTFNLVLKSIQDAQQAPNAGNRLTKVVKNNATSLVAAFGEQTENFLSLVIDNLKCDEVERAKIRSLVGRCLLSRMKVTGTATM